MLRNSIMHQKVRYFIGFSVLCVFWGGLAGEYALAEDKQSVQWERILAAAKKEGELMYYGSQKYEFIFPHFQKKYPEIKVKSVSGTARHYTARLMMERRAGKHLADLYINGASSGYRLYKADVLDPIKPILMLPEVLNESHWYLGQHVYKDDDSKYLFVFNGELQPYFSYNTEQVNPKDIKSFWDLLDPKWKGKIVMNDPTIAGAYSAIRFMYYHPDLGPKYLSRLFGEMDLKAGRDKVQLVNWLASGKYSILLFSDAQRLNLPEAKQQGLPVDWFGPTTFKEGAILGAATGVVGLIKNAPHPNAARIAINWLLSKEGQYLYQKVWNKADSLRIDIPKDNVPMYSRRRDEIKAFNTDRPEWMDMRKINKFIKKIWKR